VAMTSVIRFSSSIAAQVQNDLANEIQSRPSDFKGLAKSEQRMHQRPCDPYIRVHLHECGEMQNSDRFVQSAVILYTFVKYDNPGYYFLTYNKFHIRHLDLY
jgi:hypothetical protein